MAEWRFELRAYLDHSPALCLHGRLGLDNLAVEVSHQAGILPLPDSYFSTDYSPLPMWNQGKVGAEGEDRNVKLRVACLQHAQAKVDKI